VDCNEDGVIDLVAGEPLVCGIASSGAGVGEALTALVEAGSAPPVADLSLDKAATPDPVMTGQEITYTLIVTNGGPSMSTGVRLTDILPPQVNFSSATTNQGSCSESGGIVICELGDLASGGDATVIITAASVTGGLTSNLAILAGEEVDLDEDDNVAIAETTSIVLASIDIKPGEEPNSVNCKNDNGVIPVAVLTTDTFDALTVDHTIVVFEGASETHVDKKSGEPRRHEEDADGDGDIDLVFHFRLGDTSLTCESSEATLEGVTFDGISVIGVDSVSMVGEGGGSP
jgi:uncharacterized repeat protein (TIGR01451 family)